MTDTAFHDAALGIIAAGAALDRRGLAAATGGNHSVRLPGGTVAMTVSGRHKGRLVPGDIMRLALDGTPLDGRTPSAEAALHLHLYRTRPDTGAVLHYHSVAGTVLSRCVSGDVLTLTGYEMLKAFPGITTHEAVVNIPVVPNSQNMDDIIRAVDGHPAFPAAPCYLIRSHGIYVWGRDIAEAERVSEASEFLFACVLGDLP